ncbi:unnamed protein product [Sympodiomycopsis kandeliae]
MAIAPTPKVCGNSLQKYNFFDAATGEDLDESNDGVVPKQHCNKRRALTESEKADNKKCARLLIGLRNSDHSFANMEAPSETAHKKRSEKVRTDEGSKADRDSKRRTNDNKQYENDGAYRERKKKKARGYADRNGDKEEEWTPDRIADHYLKCHKRRQHKCHWSRGDTCRGSVGMMERDTLIAHLQGHLDQARTGAVPQAYLQAMVASNPGSEGSSKRIRRE